MNLLALCMDRSRKPRSLAWFRSQHLLWLFMFSNCAFTNPDNTPLVTGVERWRQEKELGATGYLLLPLALPLGVIDTVVVHPLSQLDEAAVSTKELIWDDPVGGTATQGYFLVPKLLFTPIYYGTNWLLRSTLDFSSIDSEEQEDQPGEGGKSTESQDPNRRALEASLRKLEKLLEEIEEQQIQLNGERERIQSEIDDVTQQLNALPE